MSGEASDGPHLTAVWYAEFFPTTQSDQGAFTKIGGLPVFIELDEWPACPGCGRIMEFWAQIRLNEPLISGSPYIMAYLFACPSERNPRLRQDCPSWRRKAPRNQIGQIVLQRDAHSPFTPEGVATFPEYLLAFIQGEELARGIVLLNENIGGARLDLFRETTKLGGAPIWWHGEQNPPCPQCGGEMRFIFQLLHKPDNGELDDAFHYGYGYLFLCARSCDPQGALMLCQHG